MTIIMCGSVPNAVIRIVQIDELMRQYADEEIDGATYAQKMMELTSSAQNDND